MRYRWHFAAALLAAIELCGISTSRGAPTSAQAAIAGRQTIRAELAAATADGHLARMDQYRILLHAREVLTPDDLKGLERTLDRLAKQDSEPTRPSHRQPSEDRYLSGGVISSERSESGVRTASVDMKYRDPGEATSAVGSAPEEVPLGPAQGVAARGVDEGPAQGCNSGCGCEDSCDCEFHDACRPCCEKMLNLELSSGVDAFKGPMDLGNANGNFGLRVGLNGAMPIAQRLGFGIQAGANEILSNLKGIPYPVPSSEIRDQTFTTVGIFQRINIGDGVFGWGFSHDWLFDDYYSPLEYGQWRIKMSYELNPWNEFGIIATINDHGTTGELVSDFGSTEVHFQPIDQGVFYWRHTWCNDASLTARLGGAEQPSEIVMGADALVPISPRMALTGGFTYIMPNVPGGPLAQTQDVWNLSIGLEFVPGGFHHGMTARFAPFIPVADNGSLAVREVP